MAKLLIFAVGVRTEFVIYSQVLDEIEMHCWWVWNGHSVLGRRLFFGDEIKITPWCSTSPSKMFSYVGEKARDKIVSDMKSGTESLVNEYYYFFNSFYFRHAERGVEISLPFLFPSRSPWWCTNWCLLILFRFFKISFSTLVREGIVKSTIDGNLGTPGALVPMVWKGVQYLQLEVKSNNVSMF